MPPEQQFRCFHARGDLLLQTCAYVQRILKIAIFAVMFPSQIVLSPMWWPKFPRLYQLDMIFTTRCHDDVFSSKRQLCLQCLHVSRSQRNTLNGAQSHQVLENTMFGAPCVCIWLDASVKRSTHYVPHKLHHACPPSKIVRNHWRSPLQPASWAATWPSGPPELFTSETPAPRRD